MNTKFGFAALSVAIAMAAGCASTTTEEPVTVAEPAPAPTPEPTPEPTPVAPVAQVVETGPLKGSVEDFVINVGDRVYFETDSYSLDDADRAVLAAQAQWLMAYPNTTILVSGNCDERGTREYNIALGERRAAAAADFLMAQGVSASRIETISFGKERPIDPRSTPQGWAQNRNTHTSISGGAVN